METKHATVVMEEVTDADELARARAQRERFDRNAAWLQAHAVEVYTHYRGKCVVIAGEELFAADTPEEAWALATAAQTVCILATRIPLSTGMAGMAHTLPMAVAAC